MAIVRPLTSPSRLQTGAAAGLQIISQRIVLGLPELCPNGMSENWLLRHCGSIHWNQLAMGLGVRPEQVRDKHGDRLYASFFRVSLEGKLTDFAEGDEVELNCELQRISPLRYKSEQVVRNGSRGGIIRMSMCSTFVKRRALNDNVHLIFSEPATSTQCTEKSDCAEARLCREASKQAGEFNQTNGFLYDPSPLTDFNGVGLFYFAQYQAALDSAEWQMHRKPALLNCGTTLRTISYFANLNVGDKLKICFANAEMAEHAVSHVAAVYRYSDGILVAEAITRKERKVHSE